jgi:transposase
MKGLFGGIQGRLTAHFPPGKGGGAEVAYGYKGKGVLIHLLVDAEGMPVSAVLTPANGDERKQVEQLVETVEVKTGKPGRPPKKIKRIAGDKGYDSQKLREFLLSKGITPQIPRKRNARPRRGRPVLMSAPRFQIERTFSWLQRTFRRLAVRWERLPQCFDSFLSLGIIVIWMRRLLG